MMGYLSNIIVAKGFKKKPKVQKIAQSGHSAYESLLPNRGKRPGLSQCALWPIL